MYIISINGCGGVFVGAEYQDIESACKQVHIGGDIWGGNDGCY